MRFSDPGECLLLRVYQAARDFGVSLFCLCKPYMNMRFEGSRFTFRICPPYCAFPFEPRSFFFFVCGISCYI